MKDTLVGFKVAKLAKEKGFNIRSEPYRYDSKGELTLLEGINAPTQSLLQKWLREIHKIDIFITKVKNNYAPSVYSKNISKHAIGVTLFGKDKTYEEALEVGLQEALKLIK